MSSEYVFPDDMDASITYDWFVLAEDSVKHAEMPEPIREHVLEEIRGAKHYCRKWDVVHPWGFDLYEHKLAFRLIGPPPAEVGV